MFFQKPCFFVFLGCFWGVFLCSENMFSWKHVFLGDVDLEPVNGSNKHITKNILETLGGDLGGIYPKTPKPSGGRFGGQNEPSTGRGVPSSEESAAHPDVMIGVAVTNKRNQH